MKFFSTFNHFYNKYLALIVVGVAALALFLPLSFLWASSYTTLFLQVVMFTMGLTMKPADFAAVFKKPWMILLVTFLQFTFMPLSAFYWPNYFNCPARLP